MSVQSLVGFWYCRYWQAAFAFILLFGCVPQAYAVKIEVISWQPARVLSLQQGVRVAVAPFSQTWQQNWGIVPSDWTSSMLAASLTGLQVGDKHYFDVLDRSQTLDIIQREQNLRAGNLVDANTLPELGRVLGAEYVLSGQARYSFDESWKYRSWNDCLEHDKNNRCIRPVTKRLHCQILAAKVVFYPRITEVKTSRIKYETRLANEITLDGCRPQRVGNWALHLLFDAFNPFSYPNDSSVLVKHSRVDLGDRAMQQLLAEFVKDIAPYPEKIKLYLRGGSKFKSVPSKSQRKQFSRQFKYAAKSIKRDLALSCRLFADLHKQAGDSDQDLVFNLGVCSEFLGNYSKAKDYYNHISASYVAQFKKMPNWLVEAQKRLDSRIQLLNKLKKQHEISDSAVDGYQ
ncbi:MAG: hypothetical protein ACR2PW_01430 [Gammaproteobacteria bacterium]